jgi:hypothetical protein
MDVIKIQERIEACRQELGHVQRELMNPGKMVAGAIIQRYTVCGKVGCRCLSGQRHGPYPALSRPNGQVVYLNRKLHGAIKPYVERYQTFQRHLSRWRKLIREVDELLSNYRQDQLLDIESVKTQINRVDSNDG